jgi:predicted RNA-binding protein (TIGR00451 family)
MWRCGFPYKHKFIGYIRGFKRLFYQVDTFHRGTMTHPGRCALVKRTGDPSDVVYGVCYQLAEDDIDEIIKSLDTREKTYFRAMIPVYIQGDIYAATAISYISEDGNDSLTEEEKSLEYTAQIIATASGNSGCNFDYLERLYNSLAQIQENMDDYIVHLYNRVKQIRNQSNVQYANSISLKESLLHTNIKGTIYIDVGAVSAISNRGKALLPCGVVKVQSKFSRGDVIEVKCATTGKQIAIGVTNYSSEQINKIKGKHSRYISEAIEEFLSSNRTTSLCINEFVNCEYVISREKMALC